MHKNDLTPKEHLKIELLKQCHIFNQLPPDKLQEIAASATSVRYSKGMIICEDGDRADFFHVVQEGLIKVYKGSASGKNLTFTIAGRGDTLNAAALSVDKYFMTAQAMNDVTVLRIGRKEFLTFLSTYPSIAMEIIALMAKRLNAECDRMVDIIGVEVEQRLSHSLFALASKFGTTLLLTREELANFAGTTTETTIRVLSKLKKKGIISCSSSRGEIVISDLTKLQNYEI